MPKIFEKFSRKNKVRGLLKRGEGVIKSNINYIIPMHGENFRKILATNKDLQLWFGRMKKTNWKLTTRKKTKFYSTFFLGSEQDLSFSRIKIQNSSKNFRYFFGLRFSFSFASAHFRMRKNVLQSRHFNGMCNLKNIQVAENLFYVFFWRKKNSFFNQGLKTKEKNCDWLLADYVAEKVFELDWSNALSGGSAENVYNFLEYSGTKNVSHLLHIDVLCNENVQITLFTETKKVLKILFDGKQHIIFCKKELDFSSINHVPKKIFIFPL